MSSQKCQVANCNNPCHIGKPVCLDHWKSQSNYAYGLDLEIQQKLNAKLDLVKLAQAQAWIEALAGERFAYDSDPDPVKNFQESLKSGVLLCKAINRIRAGSVPKINNLNAPFQHRENIANFLKAEIQLGMKVQDSFMTENLYEGTNIVVVIDNIFALGALAQQLKFNGPVIGVKHADENVRQFSDDVLAAGKLAPSRQTVGSYGYQDETKNPSLGRQIIKNVTGYQASDQPTLLNLGSSNVSTGKGLSGLDQIIKNPDEIAANRGNAQGGAAAAASSAAASGGSKFCGSCGGARVGGAKFCGNCGTPY